MSTRRTAADTTTDRAYHRYQSARRRFWNQVAQDESRPSASGYYHRRLTTLYRFLIPPGMSVIELGSGNGDLLAALEPARGLGIDFADDMVDLARKRHPQLEFRQMDAHEMDLDEKFDYVVLSDLVNDLWDVETVLSRVVGLCTADTRIIVNSFNRIWQGPIAIARWLKLVNPVLKQNWLTRQDLVSLLQVSDLHPVSVTGEILWPVRTPLLNAFFDRFLVKFWPFNKLALTTFTVARLDANLRSTGAERSVSVVVPARNEAGHIEEILERTPSMGTRTEILFVEGNSTDDTYEVIERVVEERADPNIRLYRQPGKGKGDAVRFGYQHATGEILMILDADMTVAPEDLPRFYRALVEGKGEFINGVRLVYPMEQEAMRFLNYLGNKFFGVVFSWLLRQPVRDTLCGTKVLTREAYDEIAANRSYFGDFDPFGDFDLLFGASKLNLQILDLPIRYRDRRYGTTNIDRWRHGVLLLKMSAFAAKRMKFI